MNIKEIGNRIYKARTIRNYTLDQIADEIGVAKSTIQRYEKGLINKPKIPVLQAIANSLHVNPAWLSGQDVAMEIETYDHKWDRDVQEFFDKTNAFEAELKSLGWTCEHFGCYSWFQYDKIGLRLDDKGNFSENGTNELIGCNGQKCSDCSEREEYYLFTNGKVSFRVNPSDYNSFVDDSQTFFKERLQMLLKKSMKTMFIENSINANIHIMPQAAHERTDIKVTDEMKKHDDNLMDDPDIWK